MFKTIGLATGVAAMACIAGTALAGEYDSYPVDRHDYPFTRSFLTGQAVIIPPYRRVFPVRVYHVPQQQPYYNVPPYPVITRD